MFIDTAAWLALVNEDDQFHTPTWALMRETLTARRPLYTSQFVVLEVADGLASTRWREAAIRLIDGLSSIPNLEVVPVDPVSIQRALDLYRSRPDKNWGLTDCTSFVLMKELDIADALTSDRHFEQAGFRRLL